MGSFNWLLVAGTLVFLGILGYRAGYRSGMIEGVYHDVT